MIAKQRFSTALRDHVRTNIEQLGYADIVIGVPCYYSGSTIQHVVKIILKGLEKHYRDSKAVILVSDGGSTDDTRDLARAIDTNSYNIRKDRYGLSRASRKGYRAAGSLRGGAISEGKGDGPFLTPISSPSRRNGSRTPWSRFSRVMTMLRPITTAINWTAPSPIPSPII